MQQLLAFTKIDCGIDEIFRSHDLFGNSCIIHKVLG